ncbi:Hypothetical predicted protein [Pelobates cultripes]|uniref:Uncharacterized protein n=1 Tax=Pelobates cultripes TaxID=61616 RepID=A0AAD1SEF9_PELCU|nr:Hypothetical predicted protein [Pelobates cultripes]
MASGSCNEVLLTSTEARIPHRKGLLHRNHQNRSTYTESETESGNQHHKETPETTTDSLADRPPPKRNQTN